MINDIIQLLGLSEELASNEFIISLIVCIAGVIACQLISTLTGALLYLAGWKN